MLLEELQEWIVKAENVLSATHPNSDDEMQFYGQQLEVNTFLYVNTYISLTIYRQRYLHNDLRQNCLQESAFKIVLL